MELLLKRSAVEIEEIQSAPAGSLREAQPQFRKNPLNRNRDGLLLYSCLALIAAGMFWRGVQLDRIPGVNGDEAWYGVQSQRFLEEYVFGKTLPEQERVNFRTPTGNLWNPFLMIPRLVLDALFEPSILSLRLPALISGMLTLLVNWRLCRRAFDRATAWLTTSLLAVLPIAMIYSRLGWDACQSVLFCLPLVYLPWIAERQAMSGVRTAIYFALALIAALLVHPTNIFLVPLSAALFWPRISAAVKWEWSLQSRAFVALAAIVGAVGLGITRGVWAGVEFRNLLSALAHWAGDVVGLFNGATVYGAISLPAGELPAAQCWLLLLSMPTVALLIWTRLSRKTPLFPQRSDTSAQQYAALFDGTCLALLCFLGVAGPSAIQPGYERYGLWLVAPGTLLIVSASSFWSRRSRAAQRGIALLAALQISLLLAGYCQYYQRRFAVPAAEQRLAHWTYWADNDASWPEMRWKLEQDLMPGVEPQRKTIGVLFNDPQRWWFEWQWRYLSHGSEYEWQILSSATDAMTSKAAGEHRWILRSQQDPEKEKLSIQYLAQ